jgi:dTDP-4-dehydrorhamnose reductase
MNGKVVWVTGAGGLIGNYLVRSASRFGPEFQVVGLTRDQLDLTDFESVLGMFRRQPPEAIIHCAAMSRSPECQADPDRAVRNNVEVTKHLAELAVEIPFVFLSTDLVFDGRAGEYDESAPVNPLSVYAETKVAAEGIILSNPRHTVIRTSLNSGTSPTGDRGFDEQIRNAWRNGVVLKLFVDELRSPIGAEVTARAVWELLGRKQTGLFHVAGAERLSRWEMGQLLARQRPEPEAKMVRASIRDWDGAPRPPDTSLNCAKVQRELSFALPRWSHWLGIKPTDSL